MKIPKGDDMRFRFFFLLASSIVLICRFSLGQKIDEVKSPGSGIVKGDAEGIVINFSDFVNAIESPTDGKYIKARRAATDELRHVGISRNREFSVGRETNGDNQSKFDQISVNKSASRRKRFCNRTSRANTSRTSRDTGKISAVVDLVNDHMRQGYDLALHLHDRAKNLLATGFCPHAHTASMLNFIHGKSREDLVALNEKSESVLFGMKLLRRTLSHDYDVTPKNFLGFVYEHGFYLNDTGVCYTVRKNRCHSYTKYRSLDGSCNNIAHPSWGRANSAFGRIIPPRYSDGIHAMPISVTNRDLPNVRELSAALFVRGRSSNPELSLAVMQWGQVVAHDLARQVPYQTSNRGIECCDKDGRSHLDKSQQHHSCAPISISPYDEFYSRYGQRCMNFVRSMTVLSEDSPLGPANQLNAVTSFLDCSQIYGISQFESNELREFFGGRLKVEFRDDRWMLPKTKNQSDVCDTWTSSDFCYLSGDPRTNQNPQLVILHTLLVREHNRIADSLSELNTHWDDERLFQEARRIVIAEYQHITYNEWLPLLFGDGYKSAKISSAKRDKMTNDYNEDIDPSTIIGFTSGAYRSLHSIVAGDINLYNVERDIVHVLRMDNYYFRPGMIEDYNNFEDLLRSLVSQRAEMQDNILNDQWTERLFRSQNSFGMDLAAIDIQRGRDHGVPGYNAYRKICNLRWAENFDDLRQEISPENIAKLQKAYAHVDDVDLIVGAYMENVSPGSQLGPINRCLLNEQFYRSRVGDRYFYDNANFPHSFTPQQFHEITKVTLARLICDTERAVGNVQPHAFRTLRRDNPLVECRTLPEMDLTPWME